MEDDLDNFIQEQRVRVAEDKARLEEDLPYMEIKVCMNDGISVVNYASEKSY